MTFKGTMQFVGKIVLSSMVSSGILLAIYSFTKKDNAEIIQQKEIDEKATRIELTEVKTELTEKIEAGDTALKNEFETYIQEHNATHVAEMGQLNIVVKWVQSQPQN
jgi:hypothetical protein